MKKSPNNNLSAHASLNDLLKAAGGGSARVKKEEEDPKKTSPKNQQQLIKPKDMPPQVIVTIQTNEISENSNAGNLHGDQNHQFSAGWTQQEDQRNGDESMNHLQLQKQPHQNENKGSNGNWGHGKSPSEQFYSVGSSVTGLTGGTSTVASANPFKNPTDGPFVSSTSHPRIHQTKSFPLQNINAHTLTQQQMEHGPNMIHRPGSSPSSYSRPQHTLSYDAIDPKKNAKHTKSLTLDTASLAQIAAELSTLKPMSDPNPFQPKKKSFFSNKDPHTTNPTTTTNPTPPTTNPTNTTPTHAVRNDNNDDNHDYLHLVTLGDDPKDCATTPTMAVKRHHKRFLSFQGNMNSTHAMTSANTTSHTNATATSNATSISTSTSRPNSGGTSSRPSSGAGNGSTFLPRPNSGATSSRPSSGAGNGSTFLPRPNSGGSLLPKMTLTPSPTVLSTTGATTVINSSTTESNHERLPNTEIKIRSSEQDPTPHQISIPTLSETLFQAKLCELMDNYRKIDQNFDFSCLIHMSTAQIMECVHQFHNNGGSLRSSRNSHNTNIYMDVNGKRGSIDTTEVLHRVSSMEKMDGTGHNNSSIRRGSMESINRTVSIGNNNASPTTAFGAAGSTDEPFQFINTELFNCNQQQLMMEHEPILSSILEGGDLVVEGFYHEGVTHTSSEKKSKPFDTSNEKSTQDRMEVAIFKSDTRRQIIVVYQDSVENQTNPVKKRDQKDGIQRRFHIGSGKDDDKRFSKEQPYPVFPPFRKAYFENGDIESKVFRRLDELSEQNPFYDVIMTGHSMGGVLSLLASLRYADAKPAIMVSCFAFGCPKVGSLDFRFYINSLPNLKIMRFEYGSDPWIHCPDHPAWVHAGHTIVIWKYEPKADASGSNHRVLRRTSSDGVAYANSRDLLVKAFKFGAVRPDSSGSTKGVGVGGGIGKILHRHRERNMDHEISSYVHALERIQTFENTNSHNQEVSWPTVFVGEDGSGVQGLDHEKRLVC